MSSGTTALIAAVASLGLEPGDEIIMPSFTIISCALAVIQNGLVPVLVDATPSTWCMNIEQVAARIGPRTRAILVVHIYGHPVDMDPILDLAALHGLAIIEDAAEAHGAQYLSSSPANAAEPGKAAWKICGSFGTLSTFSFYANKLITTGEGGMVLTDDRSLAERLCSIRNLGFGKAHRFVHVELGQNFRLSSLQAALALPQIERLTEIVTRKERMGYFYGERLQGLPGVQLQVREAWARPVFWMFGLIIDETLPVDVEDLTRRLATRGIETRPFFRGMHEQPVLRERGLFLGESYPVTERLGRRGFYLPSGIGLTERQMDEVCCAIGEVLSSA